MTTFIAWIEEALKSKNWKPSDLARAARVTDATLSNILNGHRNPGPDLCVGIAMALGEPPEKVFRLAGLLPPLPGDEKTAREIFEIARNLTPDQQAEALRYLRYLYQTVPNKPS